MKNGFIDFSFLRVHMNAEIKGNSEQNNAVNPNITSEDVGIINSPFRYYTIFYEHMICF